VGVKQNRRVFKGYFLDEFWESLDLEEKTGGTLANVVKWHYLNRTISSNFRQQGPSLITPALIQMDEVGTNQVADLLLGCANSLGFSTPGFD